MNISTSSPQSTAVSAEIDAKSETRSYKGFGKVARISISSIYSEAIGLQYGGMKMPTEPKAKRHFQKKLHSPEYVLSVQLLESIDIQRFQTEYSIFASTLRATQCEGFLAIACNLLYWFSICGGIAEKTNAGTKFDRQRALALLGEDLRLHVALEHTVQYSQGYWHSGVSRRSLWTRCNELRDMGLLAWEDRDFVPGEVYCANGEAQPRAKERVYTHVDVQRLLLLAEALEARLIQLRGADLDSLPKHRCNFLRMLSNLIFPGWGWRRQGPADTQAPRTYAESVAARLMNSQSWVADLARHRYQRLQEHLSRLRQVDRDLVSELYGDGLFGANAIADFMQSGGAE
jgi:hypothetical protein